MNSKIIEINPKIYPLDVIYSAAYVLLDKYYILLDGEPDKSIKVTFSKKNQKDDIENAEKEFGNYLLTYAFYKNQSEKNSPIRQMMLQAALFPITSEEMAGEVGADKNKEIELPEGIKEADYLDDPEGIAIPWEEKYKKNASKKKQNGK